MADWTTTATTTHHNTAEAYEKRMTERNRSNESVSIGDQFSQNFSQYSVVGINANKVEEMRTAIRSYVNNIMTYIDNIEPLADSAAAFQGDEARDAVQKYIDKTKEYCTNLTSSLLSFSDKLGDVKNTWDAAQATIGSYVTNDASSFSAGTKYTETIQ